MSLLKRTLWVAACAPSTLLLAHCSLDENGQALEERVYETVAKEVTSTTQQATEEFSAPSELIAPAYEPPLAAPVDRSEEFPSAATTDADADVQPDATSTSSSTPLTTADSVLEDTFEEYTDEASAPEVEAEVEPETVTIQAPSYASPDVPALQALGKQVFFDNISEPATQSCASCHLPAAGWTSGDSLVNATSVVVPGARYDAAGNRKPPSSAYASFAGMFGDAPAPPGPPPPFPLGCMTEGAFGAGCEGGLFWDGRATGEQIGLEIFTGEPALQAAYSVFLGPAADQALGPFSNDLEQNVPDGNDNGLPGAEFVCRHVAEAAYVTLYEQAFGETPNCDPDQVDISFKRIALAIAAWESSAEVNSFSSKRDWALANDEDDSPQHFPLAGLSVQENLGHDLFYGIQSELNAEGKNARCGGCHNSAGPGSTGEEPDQLYTDGRFHHLGIPPNYELANFSADAPDLGLALHTHPDDPAAAGHASAFRTPTLRNVAKVPEAGFVKAYMHNGYFKTLEDVVHFYNTAAIKVDPEACPPGTTAAEARAWDCWPAPEFAGGVLASNGPLMGDLGLSTEDEAALVAYLRALSDTETVSAPAPLAEAEAWAEAETE